MKPYYLLIFFLMSYCFAIGQDNRDVTLIIQAADMQGVQAAHLTVNGESHYISDGSGKIQLQSGATSLRLQISHISYARLDTILDIDSGNSFTLTLEPSSYSIDPVTISDRQRLFEKSNWYITDITHHDYGFVVSASEGSKSYIYLFDKNGMEVQKIRTDFVHVSIDKGLKIGHYHLMSEREGLELIVSTDTILFLNTQLIEKYDKTLHDFLYRNANYSIIEEWGAHNKEYSLSLVDNKTFEINQFYRSFDEDSYTRSQSVYREIIGLYYRDSYKLNPFARPGDENAINIIIDGTWTGDLKELIVSDTIQEVYNYYTSIYAKEMSISTQIVSDKLYVLDNMKRIMSIYELANGYDFLDVVEVRIPEEIATGEFVNSGSEEELIVLSGDSYYSYHISDKTFSTIAFEKENYYYPKTTFYDDNTLYTLARSNRTKPKMSIFKQPVSR